MPPTTPSHPGADNPDLPSCNRPGVDGRAALRLPMPVPLLIQLYRPLNTLDDVESLAAQLRSAQARGCF